MIRFIIIIALFFAVLALSPILLKDPGYILISFANQIIELTIYAALFWLTAISVLLFFSYKIIRGGFKISFNAWHKVAFASKNRGIANFNRGLAAYMLEDYQQAEQLFAKSAEPAKRQQSAYLLAAASAAQQQLDSNTDHYLNLLAQETAKHDISDLLTVIIKVKLLINQAKPESYQKARALIDENHKHLGHDGRLLALEIDLCLLEKRFQTAIDYLSAARKEKTISNEVIEKWQATAYQGVFNEIISQQQPKNLEEYWRALPRKIKQQETVLLAYCHILAKYQITEPLLQLITPHLKKQPSTGFLKQLRTLPIKQCEPLLALVQKHLHTNSKSAAWLSYLGHLAVMAEQWSMAEKAFRSLLKLEANHQQAQYDKQDLQAFAQALMASGQHQAANEVWLKINSL